MKKLQLPYYLIIGILLFSLNTYAQNILLNPSFELGAGNNFTNWTKTNGAAYLNATTVAAEVHNGTRALISNGPGNPGQQYQVQMLADAVPTTIGTSYTFKIWAKAATAGGTIRFSTQPIALYSADKPVTTAWTQLTWTFTANSANTSIALDLGESNVVYYLDDMELALTPVNLVLNPGFELGSGNVFTNWTKANGASFLTETTVPAEVYSGTRALKSAGPGNPGQQYQVQMISDAIATTIGTSYTFKIWVKAATAGGTIRFSTQPSAIYGPDTPVTTAWTQLIWTFTANVTMTKIALDLGESNVVYYLDDAEILGTPVPPSSVVLTNYAPNFSFEDGIGNTFTNWTEINGTGSFFETTVPAEVKIGSRALKVVSTIADPANPWKVQIGSAFLNTPVGKSFTYSIYIKSAAAGKVRISTISPLANYGTYGYSALTDLGTAWQKVSLTFTAVEPTTRIAIDMGGAADTYFVDEVSLTSGTALLSANGGFELGAGANFYNWTKQNGAALLTASTTEFHSGARSLSANVTGSQSNAPQPWSVQMINNAANTTLGTAYTVSFWAKSSASGGKISLSTEPTPLYSPDFTISTTWAKYDWTFTANESQTKVVMNMGKEIRDYNIDDVSISPAIVNLVANGSYENGTGDDFTGWGKYNGATKMTATTVAAEVKEGLRAVKIINPTAANAYETQLVSDPMTLLVGKNYTATIYVKSNVGGEIIRFSTNSTAPALYGPNYTTTTAWTAMTWSFTANDASTRIVLDMGTSAGTFYVDDISVVQIGDCELKYQVPSGQTPFATGKNKFVGCIYSSAQKPNIGKYFNQITPENAGKWGSVEGTEGVYDFSGLDEARAFAKVNNFPFRFHVLVWGRQQPTWLKPMTDAQKVIKVKAWFQAVANHYDGSSNARAKLEYLEVANEIINDPPNSTSNGPYSDNTNDPTSGGYLNALKTLNTELGTTPGEWDWVVNAFKLARQYFPCETKLVLNEFNAETNYLNITDKYVEIIELLKADNLIDIAGLQAHAFSTRKYNNSQSFADHTLFLKSKLDQIAATNVPLMITELDIDGDTDDTYTVTTNVTIRDAFQKAEYERIFGLYYNHPAVVGVTLWGYLNGHWRTDQLAYLVDPCTGNERPALRDYLNNTLNNTSTSVRASTNPPLSQNRAPGNCGSTVINPVKPIICPSGSITLTSSGCTGTINWTGGIAGTTASVVVSPTMSTTYTATCSTGGVATVEVKIAENTIVAPVNVASGIRVLKAVTILESNKVIGLNPTILNTDVSYTAGNSVLLNAGFEAKTGTVFKAEISGCN